jgi:serine/threonine protein phosphatase PrpC
MDLKRYAVKTDQGPVLQNNEDNYSVDIVYKMFIVADGFGGAGIGDVAVAKTIDNIKDFYLKISDDPDATLPFFYSEKHVVEVNALYNAIQGAHKLLHEMNQKLPVNRRAGISGLFACQVDSILNVFSIGNCRLYRLRGVEVELMMGGDSYQDLSRSSTRQFSNFPMSALGMYAIADFSLKEFRILPGDKFLFLTDGLYNFLETQDLSSLCAQNLDLRKSLSSLFSLTNERGNSDNQTALILEY